MSQPINVQTNLGNFSIHPDQLVGLEKVVLPGPDGPVEATKVVVTLGVIARPRTEVMRTFADAIDQANGRVVLASSGRVVLPGRGEG